jgi:hypothetical protein
MQAKPLLSEVLGDDAVTRRLCDPEARVLIEWLVERVEAVADKAPSEAAAHQEVKRLRRRARAIGCFVGLWCYECDHGGAVQLAGVERFPWPLPPADVDPCELMCGILEWEPHNGKAA